MNCKECGKEFTKRRDWQKFCCSACQGKYNHRISNAKKMANYQPKPHHKEQEEYYTLISDPLPFSQGGFRKGAKFSKTEIKHMLPKRVVYAGTVLEQNGKLFEIRANERGKLRLEQKGI